MAPRWVYIGAAQVGVGGRLVPGQPANYYELRQEVEDVGNADLPKNLKEACCYVVWGVRVL